MNAWMQTLGPRRTQALAGRLLLPPVPWLLLILLGGWQLTSRRRWLGWLLLLAGLALAWASCTSLAADWLATAVAAEDTAALRDPRVLLQPAAACGRHPVIVVLGGGRATPAPSTTA
jgi:hypothetical protein